MENNENLEQQNNELTEQKEDIVKSYDVLGLIIGAFVGIFMAIVGITDILMGIVIGMFLGLVVGSFIKKN